MIYADWLLEHGADLIFGTFRPDPREAAPLRSRAA